MIFNPHNYQTKAIAHVINTPRCALFLDMGLGKSVITLTALAELLDTAEVNHALIVAPKKVAEATWSDETAKWTHLSGLNLSLILGTADKRKQAAEKDAHIYVISRDNLAWLYSEYENAWKWDAVVLDELTSFKSNSSKRFKTMKRITARVSRVIGLTGTPAPNGLLDLWAQIYCLDMGERLGRFIGRYRAAYFNERRWNNIVVKCEPKKGAEEAIRAKLADIALTMKASDYLTLPPITEVDHYVNLTAKQTAAYKAFERDRVLEISESGEEVTATNVAALMNKLSQYASGAVYNAEGYAQELHTEKLEALREIVEGIREQGENVLIFYQYKHEISRISAFLSSYGSLSTYEGETSLQAWNGGKINILLAHPASTAYGLNMQKGGRYIVWFGTGWNFELYAQANARLHRQGQTKPVVAFRVLCRGTVDERQKKAIEGKAGTQEAMMRGFEELRKTITK